MRAWPAALLAAEILCGTQFPREADNSRSINCHSANPRNFISQNFSCKKVKRCSGFAQSDSGQTLLLRVATKQT
jgi:hypothetical protein